MLYFHGYEQQVILLIVFDIVVTILRFWKDYNCVMSEYMKNHMRLRIQREKHFLPNYHISCHEVLYGKINIGNHF